MSTVERVNEYFMAFINIVTAFFSAYIVYLIVKFIRHIVSLNKTFGDAQSPEKHWLYGNMHLLPKTSEARLMYSLQNCNSFKRYYVWWMTGAKVSITICHPDLVRRVMKTSEPKPLGFSGVYRMGLPWLGEGLLLAGGKKWARARRLLTPAFHFEILRPYVSIYNKATDVLIGNLDRYAETGEQFEVFSYITKLTLDIILRCAFSYHTDCQKESSEKHPYVLAVEEISDIWVYRTLRPWLYPDKIFYLTSKGRQFKRNCDLVHSVAEEIIQQRKKILEEKGNTETEGRKYLDFLDILLKAKDETGQGLTPLEIRNEVDTFLFEGHDTTASALSWILYCLAKHPEYQARCQQEIDAILEGAESDDIQYEDLAKMEYTALCIKEGLRHYTPVPFIQREFKHDFELEGKVFPAGTAVTLNIYALHHLNDFWEKPMEYNPERFSKDNITKLDTFQFVPFSVGPRNCIGQNFAMNEEKVVLARLLKRYKFELNTEHKVQMKVGVVLRSETGIYMSVRRR